MNEISFNIEELNNLIQRLNTNYQKYKETAKSLDEEIIHLEQIMGENDNPTYIIFKDKYLSKKNKIQECERMIKEIIDILQQKRDDYLSATLSVRNNFE